MKAAYLCRRWVQWDLNANRHTTNFKYFKATGDLFIRELDALSF